MKKLCFLLIFILACAVSAFAASSYDKDIVILDQSRNDKVTAVFKEMIDSYREKDVRGFFEHISEDRFIQDYMTFHEAILLDMRMQDILSVDTWINKITTDGIKRYLYVRWEKRYEDTDSDKEIRQLGSSRFLFDEIDGEYKLVEIAGNHFWGGSLPEWKAEVPPISGQEKETTVNAAGLNIPPTANAGTNQRVVTGSVVTLDGSGSSDANGDTLTYTWSVSSKPVGSTVALSSKSAVTPSFTTNSVGTYIFNLIVNDGKVNSTISTVKVVVIANSGSISVGW
ncbi:MAG: PKD domain-containing protein [Desulfuromonadaceae bacterium]|nr:PKD domain-containing protein [Desulfuromonadaceae bacterium]MDD2853998.1 PKD domain-containing protein [Desulfuromonadaceae bacterium]